MTKTPLKLQTPPTILPIIVPGTMSPYLYKEKRNKLSKKEKKREKRNENNQEEREREKRNENKQEEREKRNENMQKGKRREKRCK